MVLSVCSFFVCLSRDLVHRQTACAAIKHMALGVFGFGCEDALTHLMNHVWPNIFETSPHVINAVMESIEGMRVATGPARVLHYVLQVRSNSRGIWMIQCLHTLLDLNLFACGGWASAFDLVLDYSHQPCLDHRVCSIRQGRSGTFTGRSTTASTSEHRWLFRPGS